MPPLTKACPEPRPLAGPHAEFSEEVKAVFRPKAMAEDEGGAAELEAELIAHCRARLADLKCPRSIDFRAELPRHDTAKLYERLLRDGYAAGGRGLEHARPRAPSTSTPTGSPI